MKFPAHMVLGMVLFTNAGQAMAAVSSPVVDPALCQSLVKHTPSADVAYQPGVDVNGRPVAPADLPGSGGQIDIPRRIDSPVTLNVAKMLNLDTTQFPYNNFGTGTEALIGTFSVEGDRVTFNGKPLSDQQQDNLAVICMKETGPKP